MRDFGVEAQRAAEAHLEACQRALDSDDGGYNENGFPYRAPPEVRWPEMAGPYDGCETCMVREVLWAAWPIMRAAAIHEFADAVADGVTVEQLLAGPP